jgi:hypothetical protein
MGAHDGCGVASPPRPKHGPYGGERLRQVNLSLLKSSADVETRHLPRPADGDDLRDLPETEAEPLRHSDEPQQRQHVLSVQPVPGLCALRGRRMPS